MTRQSAKSGSRTGAAAPRDTKHLSHGQKQALDITADAEHSDGSEHEEQVKDIQRLGAQRKRSAAKDRE